MNKVANSEASTPRDREDRAPLLDVKGLTKAFRAPGWLGTGAAYRAVNDVSFAIGHGEIVALVGESGSGKSTIARMLLRLEPPTSGSIRFDGADVLTTEPRKASQAYRRRVQMVFQDPFGSLSPMHSVASHLEAPLSLLANVPKADIRTRSLALLTQVGLEPAAELVDRAPHELSGGQRQRVAIARALAASPDLLVADEPTSMLDVSLRSGVLTLLGRLREERGLSILLITHDLAAARHLSDRVLVLYRGRVVESGPSAEIVREPLHPYTRALIGAVTAERIAPSNGERPSEVAATPGGCAFAPRCVDRHDRCDASDPALALVRPDRLVRCHLHPSTPERPES